MTKLVPGAAAALIIGWGVAGCPAPSPPPRVVDVEPIDAGSAGANATTVRDSTTPGSTPARKVSPRGPKAPSLSLESMTTAGKVTVPPGKVVIVDFWATWCAPCKKSFPKLQELYVKYKASGLEIAAVSVDDDKAGILAFAKANGNAKFPIGWDKGKQVASAWKPETMPTTFIVDKDGNIAHTHQGYREGEIDEIEREIKALF